MRRPFVRRLLTILTVAVAASAAGDLVGPDSNHAEAASKKIRASQIQPGMRVAATARVVDAGTIAFGRTRIKLDGIVAPHRSKRCLRFDGGRAATAWKCGTLAAAALRAVADGERVVCTITGKRRGILAGSCQQQGRDLASHMVRLGWAQVGRGTVARKLAAIQVAAKTSRHGLWQNQIAVKLEHWQHSRTLAQADSRALGSRALGSRTLGDRIRSRISVSIG